MARSGRNKNDNDALNEIAYNTNIIAGSSNQFAIPSYDYISFSYVGSTNNVATQVFKTGGSGGTTVATLTYTYVGSGASNDDKVLTITKS